MKKFLGLVVAVIFLTFSVLAFAGSGGDQGQGGQGGAGGQGGQGGQGGVGGQGGNSNANNSNNVTATGGAGGHANAVSGSISGAISGSSSQGGNASIVDNSKTTNTNTNMNVNAPSATATIQKGAVDVNNTNLNINAPSATIQKGAVDVDNKNVNKINNKIDNNVSVENKVNNRNAQKQKQQQGQVQEQGQSLNNNQTISPRQSQNISQNFEATEIPAGLGREFAPSQGMINPSFVAPNAPVRVVKGTVPLSYLPKDLTLAEARELGKSGKTEVMVSSRVKYSMDKIVVVTGKGPGKNFVTGYSADGSVPAYAAALAVAMDLGAVSAEVVAQGITSTPSSFFIGLGSSYTQSQLSGSEKDNGITAGGSGLIGYSRGSQSSVFFFTIAIHR
jgi:hypothetical protein